MMSQLQTKLLTDTWVTATWDEYIEIIKQPEYDRAKCYYYNGQLRIEMAAVGPDHADDNGIIVILINLFGIAKGIKMRLLVNCSYAKTGVRGAQPDASYYIGDRVQTAPRGSSVVNLDSLVSPDLAIEIADSSLVDDLGTKRMIYEELGVSEYWVVDVQKAQVIAFKIIANLGKRTADGISSFAGAKSCFIRGRFAPQSPDGQYRSRQLVFRGSSRESSIVLTTAFFFLTGG
jgi:Uma2 family endonuclease